MPSHWALCCGPAWRFVTKYPRRKYGRCLGENKNGTGYEPEKKDGHLMGLNEISMGIYNGKNT